MYFGGVNGFVSVKLELYNESGYMPPIHFNGLLIFGKEFNLWSFVKRNKGNQTLTLNHNQNFFSVRFSAIDYINGNNYTY